MFAIENATECESETITEATTPASEIFYITAVFENETTMIIRSLEESFQLKVRTYSVFLTYEQFQLKGSMSNSKPAVIIISLPERYKERAHTVWKFFCGEFSFVPMLWILPKSVREPNFLSAEELISNVLPADGISIGKLIKAIENVSSCRVNG